jgi:hypothetical protein
MPYVIIYDHMLEYITFLDSPTSGIRVVIRLGTRTTIAYANSHLKGNC